MFCRSCLRRLVPGETEGKALVYAMSHGDSSFDDETTLVGEQAARVL